MAVPDFEIVPTGLLEGAPVAVLEFTPTSAAAPISPPELLQSFLSKRAPGIRGAVLKGAVPWGREDLNRSLLYMLSDERFGEGTVWCRRRVSEAAWPSVDIHWVMDVTELLAEPVGVVELVEKLALLPYLPAPAELVCFSPHRSNLVPVILDELATRLDPEFGAWIYDDSDRLGWSIAEKAVVGCASRWSLRRRSSGGQAI